MNRFLRTAYHVGQLVEQKNAAYGSSFAKAGAFLRLLYPDGLAPVQYDDALLLVRIFDKQMRIATNRDALGESPYRDIAGYGILGASLHEPEDRPHGGKGAPAREVSTPVSATGMQKSGQKPEGKVLQQRLLHEGLSRPQGKKGSGRMPSLRKKSQKTGQAS